MNIELQLRQHHCIQTAAKRTYERLIRAYLKQSAKGKASETMEAEIEGLKFLLETCDFPHMRGQYPELSGREDIDITLEIPQEKKDMVIACQGRWLYPKWRREDFSDR